MIIDGWAMAACRRVRGVRNVEVIEFRVWSRAMDERDETHEGVPVSRRAALAGLAGTAVAPMLSAGASAAGSGGELTWLPATRIRELVSKREVSALEVTDHFLARIERLNPT